MNRHEHMKSYATLFTALMESVFRVAVVFVIIPAISIAIDLPLIASLFLIVGAIMFATAPFVKVVKGVYV